MQLIDIGVNLTHPSLARQAREVLDRAYAAGVWQLVLTGTDVQETRQALDMSRELDRCAPASGQPVEQRHGR